MSLSVAGVWSVGVWDQTVWAAGVWREGAAPESSGGDEDFYLRRRKIARIRSRLRMSNRKRR